MSDESPKTQVAALPYRKRENRIEVLLVTSRETKRWVIPKGWPMPGLKDFTSAKREALEEAGVTGQISKTPIGTYDYEKGLKAGAAMNCSVLVFRLQVKTMLRNWKEQHERMRKWFSPKEAAKLVQEPALKIIIKTLV